ncbi:HEAT repeat domain-containing protein [Chloroflexi bacterium TSY]|nr:HEAT repeat domain-containing protein [Chloroflexi bacterium TSY]
MTTSNNTGNVSELKKRLENADPSVRFNAGVDLVRLGETAGIPAIIEAFEHESVFVRLFHAAKALIEMGEPAVPILNETLQSENKLRRVDAAFALYHIDQERLDELLPIVLAILDETDPTSVTATLSSGPLIDILRFLGAVGPAAHKAVPNLLRVLHAQISLDDPDAWMQDVRTCVAAVLAQIAEPDDEIIDTLCSAMYSESESLRWGAARAFGDNLNFATPQAIEELIAVIRNEDEVETVRVEAAYSLATISEPETETLPALLDALNSDEWWVRVFAARLLGEISSPPPTEPLEPSEDWMQRLFHPVRDVRRLPESHELSKQVIPFLVEALSDGDYNVRRNAIFALANIGHQTGDALPYLTKTLQVDDLGPIAAEACAKIGHLAIPFLTHALNGESFVGRRHAAYALGLIDLPEAQEALSECKNLSDDEPLTPAPHHFYIQKDVLFDETKLHIFEELYHQTLARGRGSEVDYQLLYPKHEFLRYLVQYQGLFMHGSKTTDIDILRPFRYGVDGADHGNVNGVYADQGYMRPIYFATIHGGRCFGQINGFFELTEDGQVSLEGDQGFERRYYKLCMGVNGLRRNPWNHGMVYALPPDTFEFWNEWTSRVPVPPVMKLAVTPEDLPLLNQVWGIDSHMPGDNWVRPDEPFPFLKDVRYVPIHPSGRPPWLEGR